VVLEVIRSSHEHLTAAEIFEAARELLPSISYATVYNSLKYLKESGRVRELSFGNNASRYDRETERHDHANCTRCGKLVDFEIPETAELMRTAAERSSFRPISIELTLIGVCPDCGDKE
jgi:Fur family transcriptional regulator, peroxide stress response regulator